MSEESATSNPVVLTHGVFDAVDGHDFDAAVSRFATDAIWESHVLEASFKGVEAIRQFMTRWSAAYDAFELQAEDISDFGGGVVLCVFMNRATDEVDEPSLRFGLVVLWRDNLIRRVIGSEDVAGARAIAERLAAERR